MTSEHMETANESAFKSMMARHGYNTRDVHDPVVLPGNILLPQMTDDFETWRRWIQRMVLQTSKEMLHKPFPVGVYVAYHSETGDVPIDIDFLSSTTIENAGGFSMLPRFSVRQYAPLDATPTEYQYRPEGSDRDYMASLDVVYDPLQSKMVLLFTAFPKVSGKPMWMSMAHKGAFSLDQEIEKALREELVEEYQANWWRMISGIEKLDQSTGAKLHAESNGETQSPNGRVQTGPDITYPLHMIVGIGITGTESQRFSTDEEAQLWWRNNAGRFDFVVWVAYEEDGSHEIVETSC